MRAVFDVNVIISSVIAPLGASRVLFDHFRDARLELAISSGMVHEVHVKLRLPRIARRYHLTAADADAVTELLMTQTTFVEVPAALFQQVTGDPEDDYVLATCVVSQADYLVTGDKGLLDLTAHHGTQIVTPRGFVDLLDVELAGP